MAMHPCACPQSDIILGKRLGTGGFGTVFKGEIKEEDGTRTPIIIKKVREAAESCGKLCRRGPAVKLGGRAAGRWGGEGHARRLWVSTCSRELPLALRQVPADMVHGADAGSLDMGFPCVSARRLTKG